MIKNFFSTFGMGMLLIASSTTPVLAKDISTSTAMMSKKEVAVCMKAPTLKKKIAYKTAEQAYHTAINKAHTDYKNALKVAGDVFKNENKMCKAVQKKTVVVELKGQNDSNITGKATLKEEDGKVKVMLALNGSPVGVSEPAHIHTGYCTNLGGVKYGLTSAIDGKSETTLNVTLAQIASGLPFAINVHKSDSEANVYVACGDIKF